jgi:hypothetical protein
MCTGISVCKFRFLYLSISVRTQIVVTQIAQTDFHDHFRGKAEQRRHSQFQCFRGNS